MSTARKKRHWFFDSGPRRAVIRNVGVAPRMRAIAVEAEVSRTS